MLQCCESRPKTLSVPEFFAVGKTFRAFLFRVVKGGVPLSKNLNICDYQGSSEPSYWKLSFHKSFDTTFGSGFPSVSIRIMKTNRKQILNSVYKKTVPKAMNTFGTAL